MQILKFFSAIKTFDSLIEKHHLIMIFFSSLTRSSVQYYTPKRRVKSTYLFIFKYIIYIKLKQNMLTAGLYFLNINHAVLVNVVVPN